MEPFRSCADELVAMFQTADAASPDWHRRRAAALQLEAKTHPVAAVANAYRRLAARHVATAQLLEQ